MTQYTACPNPEENALTDYLRVPQVILGLKVHHSQQRPWTWALAMDKNSSKM